MAAEIRIIEDSKEEIIETVAGNSFSSNAMPVLDTREFKDKSFIEIKSVEEDGFKFQIVTTHSIK